jgi:hypothetical protein
LKPVFIIGGPSGEPIAVRQRSWVSRSSMLSKRSGAFAAAARRAYSASE